MKRHCSFHVRDVCLRCFYRKVSKIVEELCGKSVSKSFVSSLTEQLDPMVNEWQEPFTLRYELSLSDDGCSLHKSPRDHRVLSKSCHIAVGITEDGDREIIGFMIQNEESDDTWSIFFISPKNAVYRDRAHRLSDALSLVSAIRKSFTSASWQRCQVHFLKSSVPFNSFGSKSNLQVYGCELTRTAKNALVGEYIDQSKYTKACRKH